MESTVGEGVSLPVVARTITQAQLNSYAEASGDHNPLHLDADFAARTQFGGIIAHGMLTLGFVAEMLADAFGRAWLANGALKVRFKGAAYVGDEVETWGRVSKITEPENSEEGRLLVCEVGARNRLSQQELVSGTATVRLD
jgi:3-hydroxybutyryl-CoA dehydratase